MTYKQLCQRLTTLYDDNEARAIIRTILDECCHLSLTDIACGGVETLSPAQQEQMETVMRRLEQAEPVQYVLGEAPFCGRSFHVEPGVLIPRPETEDLVMRVVEDMRSLTPAMPAPRILDAGTGSGCIATTLALELPHATVTAWDLSERALSIAQENARRLGAGVTFERQDMLSPTDRGPFDVIVSNPPYICERERSEMQANVLRYEPQEALFVPDNDPLLFYRALADYACASGSDVMLYFELNPLYARQTAEMLETAGFHNTDVFPDRYGKQRFIKTER